MNDADAAAAALPVTRSPLRGMLLYFLKLGAAGFGGPIALAGYMQRDLVEERGWISKEDYVEGLALAQLAPGPLATQLAIYLGWVDHGVLGATLVGLAFVLPSFLMVLGLALLYVRFGGLSWMQGAFYGIGAAVIAIILRSTVKLAKLTLNREWLLWAIFALTAVVTAWTEREVLWLFLLAGVVTLLWKAPPRFAKRPSGALSLALPWMFSGLGSEASRSTLWRIFVFFCESGAVVFGSGLAIVPFLHGGVVSGYHWLTERQFVDAVAVAMITPGPVVITVAFIGFLVAGLAGASLAALGVFLPCYLFVIIPAPFYRRWAKVPQIKAFVDGVTSAATGAIAGATWVLGRRAIIDVPTLAIAAVTALVLFRTKRVPEPLLIAATGVVGVVLHTFR